MNTINTPDSHMKNKDQTEETLTTCSVVKHKTIGSNQENILPWELHKIFRNWILHYTTQHQLIVS
jgi:hypothetical protein